MSDDTPQQIEAIRQRHNRDTTHDEFKPVKTRGAQVVTRKHWQDTHQDRGLLLAAYDALHASLFTVRNNWTAEKDWRERLEAELFVATQEAAQHLASLRERNNAIATLREHSGQMGNLLATVTAERDELFKQLEVYVDLHDRIQEGHLAQMTALTAADAREMTLFLKLQAAEAEVIALRELAAILADAGNSETHGPDGDGQGADSCRGAMLAAPPAAFTTQQVGSEPTESHQLLALRGQLQPIAIGARAVMRGFQLESINGVVCSIPDSGLDTPTHRTWCASCQRRYQLLLMLADQLEQLAGVDPGVSSTPAPEQERKER